MGLYSIVSMVVADGLAPIWRQNICNHHDDVVSILSAPRHDFYQSRLSGP